MGTGGDPKQPRVTREFDSETLAQLTRAAGGEPADREPATAVTAEPSEPPLVPRTSTVHDPLTMALLAEVARTSRTVDLDPDKLEEAKAAAAAADASLVHPRVKRR